MGFIIAVLFIEIIGIFLVTTALKREEYTCSGSEVVSLSFFVGMFFISLQTLVFYLYDIPLSFKNVVALPAVMLLLIIARYVSRPERLKETLISRENNAWTGFEKCLMAGMIFQFLWIIFLTLPVPIHSHDAVANYALKAKMLYFSGMVPEGFFRFGEATVSHPDYPPLLPFIMNWIYTFTGFNDVTVRMIMPVIYLMSSVLFYSLLRRIFDRKYSLLTVFILATIPQFYDYATIIHTDLVLTAFVTCALTYFVLYIRTGIKIQAILSAFLFGAALWVKNEAVVFAGAFVLLFAVLILRSDAANRRKTSRDMVSALVTLTVIALPWFFVRFFHAVLNSDINPMNVTGGRILQNIKDIPVLLDLFQQEVFGPKKWNIFWIIMASCMIWKRKVLWKNENFYIMAFLLITAAGYFAGFMLTTGNNLFFYVNTTISRFMLHFTGITLLLAAFLCRDEYRETQ